MCVYVRGCGVCVCYREKNGVCVLYWSVCFSLQCLIEVERGGGVEDLCSVLTGRKHDFIACKLVKNGLSHRWYIPLVSWVPPETFQTLTFTSNDNKDAGYTCFRYKNMLNKVFRYYGV